MFQQRFYSTIAILFLLVVSSVSQKNALQSITSCDLKMHMDFLASDELKGRANGEAGLNIAARYLAVQAERIGLKPVNKDEGFYQYYLVEERAYDWDRSRISILSEDGKKVVNDETFFVLPGISGDSMVWEGPIVFAGYGIRDTVYDYNDFKGVEIKDKIVLIMNRAPMNEDGTESKFGSKWMDLQSIRYKIQQLTMLEPAAILIVFDPKSGLNSIEDIQENIADYLSKSRKLKRDEGTPVEERPGPKVIFIHRSLADQILAGSGNLLDELQKQIDQTLEPHSFEVENQKLKIELVIKKRDLKEPNIFGIIKGSDPKLKNEMVIYTAHFDHIGEDGKGGIYNGADDNASGTVALLEIAQAFLKEKHMPKRSIGFLWDTAEELGLFGSSYFTDHPLVPMDYIVTAINLDMIGRTTSEEDLALGKKDMTIEGGDSLIVIGAMQSSKLMEINEKTLSEMGLIPDYTYNTPNHPDRFFYRSDHYNFAKQDIPVLFYTTGTHSDYHQITDDPWKINYEKFLRVTKFAFKVGYNISNYKGEITVDNPMSAW